MNVFLYSHFDFLELHFFLICKSNWKWKKIRIFCYFFSILTSEMAELTCTLHTCLRKCPSWHMRVCEWLSPQAMCTHWVYSEKRWHGTISIRGVTSSLSDCGHIRCPDYIRRQVRVGVHFLLPVTEHQLFIFQILLSFIKSSSSTATKFYTVPGEGSAS